MKSSCNSYDKSKNSIQIFKFIYILQKEIYKEVSIIHLYII